MTVPLMQRAKPSILLALVIVVLAAGIFAIDLTSPIDVACGTLYITVILLALLFDDRRYTILVAAFCSFLICSAALTALVVYISQEGHLEWKDSNSQANR